MLAPTGRAFTEDRVGADLATRNLMTALRDAGEIRGGGRPFGKKDRAHLLQALATAVHAARRAGRNGP